MAVFVVRFSGGNSKPFHVISGTLIRVIFTADKQDQLSKMYKRILVQAPVNFIISLHGFPTEIYSVFEPYFSCSDKMLKLNNN